MNLVTLYYTFLGVMIGVFVIYQIVHFGDTHCNVYTGKCTDGTETKLFKEDNDGNNKIR